MLTLETMLRVLHWRQSYGEDIGPIPRDRLPASHYHPTRERDAASLVAEPKAALLAEKSQVEGGR
jgi:hypothetical protein